MAQIDETLCTVVLAAADGVRPRDEVLHLVNRKKRLSPATIAMMAR